MKIANITCICETSERINFKSNKKFSGKIIKKFNVCFLIFKNGKMVITGSKNLNMAIKAAKLLLCELNPRSFIKSIEITNMTYSGFVELKNSWEILKQMKCFFYEPELFPALYWKKDSKTIMLFHSGKYILTGVKKESTAHDLKQEFLDLITPFLKKDIKED